jgi:hypothetical protein
MSLQVSRGSRTEVALFLLVAGTFAYFYQAGGWNANSRFDLTRSLIERRSVVIDDYRSNTGDLAKKDDHYYCDKAPGISVLAAAPYALERLLSNNATDLPSLERSAYVCTLVAVSLPSALGVVALFRLLAVLGLAASARALLALAYAFCTTAFPYSTLFYGHQTSAALIVIAFSLLTGEGSPRRLFAVGSVLGVAVATEYPAVIGLVVLAWYAARKHGLRGLVPLALGLAPPLLALAAYHTSAFGGPLTPAYSFSTQAPRHSGVFMGLSVPRPHALYGILFSEYRGLFFTAPWLLLAGPGAFLMLRTRRYRDEALACLGLVVPYVCMNASLPDWHAGWGVGPRHLVATLPALAILVGGISLGESRVWRVLSAAGVLTGTASLLLMIVATAVKPEVPRDIHAPFTSYLLPAFAEGRVAVNTQSILMFTSRSDTRHAWNLGEKLGLEGRASLIPLAAFAVLVSGWLAATLAGAPSPTPRDPGMGPAPPASKSQA